MQERKFDFEDGSHLTLTLYEGKHMGLRPVVLDLEDESDNAISDLTMSEAEKVWQTLGQLLGKDVS